MITVYLLCLCCSEFIFSFLCKQEPHLNIFFPAVLSHRLQSLRLLQRFVWLPVAYLSLHGGFKGASSTGRPEESPGLDGHGGKGKSSLSNPWLHSRQCGGVAQRSPGKKLEKHSCLTSIRIKKNNTWHCKVSELFHTELFGSLWRIYPWEVCFIWKMWKLSWTLLQTKHWTLVDLKSGKFFNIIS